MLEHHFSFAPLHFTALLSPFEHSLSLRGGKRRKKKKKKGERKVCLESANEISPLFPPGERGKELLRRFLKLGTRIRNFPFLSLLFQPIDPSGIKLSNFLFPDIWNRCSSHSSLDNGKWKIGENFSFFFRRSGSFKSEIFFPFVSIYA